jgi:hypothetical protein
MIARFVITLDASRPRKRVRAYAGPLLGSSEGGIQFLVSDKAVSRDMAVGTGRSCSGVLGRQIRCARSRRSVRCANQRLKSGFPVGQVKVAFTTNRPTIF